MKVSIDSFKVFSIPMRKPEEFQNSCVTAFFNTFGPLLGMILWENPHVLNVLETLFRVTDGKMAGNYGSFSFEVPFYTSVLGVGQDPADVSVESFNVETLVVRKSGSECWNNLQVNFGWISHIFTWDLWSIEDFHGWKQHPHGFLQTSETSGSTSSS